MPSQLIGSPRVEHVVEVGVEFGGLDWERLPDVGIRCDLPADHDGAVEGLDRFAPELATEELDRPTR